MSNSDEHFEFSNEPENQEANQTPPPNQSDHHSPTHNNSEPDSDSDEDPVDMAVISALTNIKNCLRRGSFTKKSLVNF